MNRIASISLLAVSCLLTSACDLYFDPGTTDPVPPGSSDNPTAVPPSTQDPSASDDASPDDPLDSAEPPVLVACDDLGYLDTEWLEARTTHFRFHYLPGTAAEADILDIQSTREQSYLEISATLGITEQPVLDVYLSPSRQAAKAQGLSFGRAFPGYDRYDAIYTGADNSFENNHYGHLIAANLGYYIAPDHPRHMYILSVGINETLDGAERDMHQAYARRLNSGAESMTHMTDLAESDVWGSNIGRAGSLVRFLVQRYGWQTFLDIYRHTNIEWTQGCYRHDAATCIDTAAASTGLLSNALQAATGDSWSEVRVMWRVAVQQALDQTVAELAPHDRAAIESLLSVADHAVSANDALAYRRIMDGFYCDWSNEDDRMAIARRVVESLSTSTSRLVAAYPNGIKNFDEAIAIVERVDDRGIVTHQRLSLEKFSEGWRVTWTDEWR